MQRAVVSLVRSAVLGTLLLVPPLACEYQIPLVASCDPPYEGRPDLQGTLPCIPCQGSYDCTTTIDDCDDVAYCHHRAYVIRTTGALSCSDDDEFEYPPSKPPTETCACVEGLCRVQD